jgi:hypothetical protein
MRTEEEYQRVNTEFGNVLKHNFETVEDRINQLNIEAIIDEYNKKPTDQRINQTNQYRKGSE